MSKRGKQSDDAEECEVLLREMQKLVARTKGVDRARALMQLGDAATVNARAELALASFGAALDLLDQGKFPHLVAEALFKESSVLAEMGRFDEALQRVEGAKNLCLVEGDQPHLAVCEWKQGMYCAELGRTSEGIKLIESARDRYRTLPGFEDMLVCVELDLEHAIQMRDGG